jgi:IQ calmodulin-binding motif
MNHRSPDFHFEEIFPRKYLNLIGFNNNYRKGYPSSDLSIRNNPSNKKKNEIYLEYLIKQKNRIIGQSEVRKIYETALAPMQKEKFKIKTKKKDIAAIKIQKVVRGWLVRKLYENEFISISRRLANYNLNDLYQNLPKIYLFGNNFLRSVLKIQKAFRKYRMKKKIVRLGCSYNFVVRTRLKLAAENRVNEFTKVLISKARVLIRKEEVKIDLDLNKIKMKLAIITIGKINEV